MEKKEKLDKVLKGIDGLSIMLPWSREYFKRELKIAVEKKNHKRVLAFIGELKDWKKREIAFCEKTGKDNYLGPRVR